tara:strand:+ start:274 stop:465 length:192 start_codon:yes stop_codon:yes gene_type:complete
MITTEYGKQNVFPSEIPPRIMNQTEQEVLLSNAEQLNGRLAMIGFVAAFGAYLTTGQIIPGVF